MGFVIGGFLGLALVVGGVWLAIFLFTHRGESRRWSAAKRNAEWRRALRTPGARLRCEGCGGEFVGPLPEEGCPTCHCAAFVVAVPGAAKATAATAPPPVASGDDEAEPIRVGVGTGGDA